MNMKVLIQENLAVVTANAPDVVARFYTTLFARNPELTPLFGRRSAEAQQKMLLEAILAVVDHLEDAPWLDSTLRGLGRKHVGYGVTDAMYPLVAVALVDTLRDASADAWNEPTQQAWETALGFIAERMIAGAHEDQAAE